jgi:hypothetical protein
MSFVAMGWLAMGWLAMGWLDSVIALRVTDCLRWVCLRVEPMAFNFFLIVK